MAFIPSCEAIRLSHELARGAAYVIVSRTIEMNRAHLITREVLRKRIKPFEEGIAVMFRATNEEPGEHLVQRPTSNGS